MPRTSHHAVGARVFERPPGPWLRRLARLPIVLYRLGLGPVLGHRFLVVVHHGRRTGRPYRTILEVVRWDHERGEAVVASGWGERASWWRNLQAAHAAEVWLAADRFFPEQRVLDMDERIEALREYRRAHPWAASVGRRLGIDTSEPAIAATAERLPMVAFRAPADGGRVEQLRYLTAAQARRVYDRIGRLQDLQALYEHRAISTVLAHADFEHAEAVFELGHGTGAFAQRLFKRYLPAGSRYLGVDVSSRMHNLARQRLRPYGERAELYLSDGSLELPFDDDAFDRFVASYVLDLLSPDQIDFVLRRAHGLLIPGGLLCLTSLTFGATAPARVVTRVWQALWSRRPQVVGGCRPIRLTDRLDQREWMLRYQGVVTSVGVTSEVVVAAKHQRRPSV